MRSWPRKETACLQSAFEQTRPAQTLVLVVVVLLASWMGFADGGYFAVQWVPATLVLAALAVIASLTGVLRGSEVPMGQRRPRALRHLHSVDVRLAPLVGEPGGCVAQSWIDPTVPARVLARRAPRLGRGDVTLGPDHIGHRPRDRRSPHPALPHPSPPRGTLL